MIIIIIIIIKGVEFLQELSCRLAAISDDNHQTSFWFQCISIMLKRFNAIMFADTFAKIPELDTVSL